MRAISLITACLLTVCSLSSSSLALPEPGSRVALRCRIIPDPDDEGYKPWNVELRKSTGEPLVRTKSASGQTLKFEDLEPGIYVLCLTGDKGRSRCKSIDLTPAPGRKYQRFDREIKAPSMSMRRSDLYEVGFWRLAVPDEAKVQFDLAEKARLRNDTEGYVAHLMKAIEIYPEFLIAWNRLGAYYHREGSYELAAECFARITVLDSGSYVGWVNLGGSLLMMMDFEKALQASSRALEIRPNEALAYSNAGLAHYYMRNYDSAKSYFEKVLKIDPGFANSPDLFLAHIAFAQERIKDALEHLRSFLKLHPNSSKAAHVKMTIKGFTAKSLGMIRAIQSTNAKP